MKTENKTVLTAELLKTLKMLLENVNLQRLTLLTGHCYFLSDHKHPIPQNATHLLDAEALEQRLSQLPFYLHVDAHYPYTRTLFINGEQVAQSASDDELKELNFAACSSYLRGIRNPKPAPATGAPTANDTSRQVQQNANAFILRYMADQKSNNGK